MCNQSIGSANSLVSIIVANPALKFAPWDMNINKGSWYIKWWMKSLWSRILLTCQRGWWHYLVDSSWCAVILQLSLLPCSILTLVLTLSPFILFSLLIGHLCSSLSLLRVPFAHRMVTNICRVTFVRLQKLNNETLSHNKHVSNLYR